MKVCSHYTVFLIFYDIMQRTQREVRYNIVQITTNELIRS